MPTDVRQAAAELMLRRGWKHKAGKQHGFHQSLFEHTMLQLDLLKQLAPVLLAREHFSVTANELRLLQAGVIAHDVGKATAEWQEYIYGRGEWVSHTVPEYTRRHLPEFMDALGFADLATEDVLRVVENCINLHMKYARNPGSLFAAALSVKDSTATDRWWTLARIVDAADNICSANGIWDGLSALERSVFSDHVRAGYHLLTIRGVSTPLLHQAALDAFIALGWVPLVHYPNGTIYGASRASDVQCPTRDDIRDRLTARIADICGKNVTKLVVGNPTENILPKPELIEHAESRQYLAQAATRIGRRSFASKKREDRLRVVKAYLKLKGIPEAMADEKLSELSEAISEAQPEMVVFKFFKGLMSEGLVGKEGFGLAAREYETLFGPGSWRALQSTSTLMPAKDMMLTIDFFHSLPGVAATNPAERIELLVEKLNCIAQFVFRAVAEPPSRGRLAARMAEGFLVDLITPAESSDIKSDAERQLAFYSASKPFAGREVRRAQYFCPICNRPFLAGAKALADFVSKPESHTNRAVSHGPFQKVMVCADCKNERVLRQLLLGKRPEEMILLFPRMNISPEAGSLLVNRVREIYNRALSIIEAEDGDTTRNITFSLTGPMANNAAGRDLYGLTSEEVLDLITYRSGEQKMRTRRRDTEKALRNLFEDDIDELNDDWMTQFADWDEASEALLSNQVPKARDVRLQVLKRIPQFGAVCRTPHLIILPLSYPISLEKDSDTNAALRKLFTSALIALSLDTAVAIVTDDESFPAAGIDGVVRVPPVPAVRALIERVRISRSSRSGRPALEPRHSEWLDLDEAELWLRAIGAAARLTGATSYPASSNLFAILTAASPGHILRRIETQGGAVLAQPSHFALIEQVKEVLV
jgi:hypothetical protein